MNSEIKALLALHDLSPPPKVITEEEVLEWLLDQLQDCKDRLAMVKMFASGDDNPLYKCLNPQKELLL